ncbi:Carboxylic ester hydrolase [Mycena sanguinolenta]|uniref:Carboxylic ester hydrolase n=1 Tax=Mycena sanguinolenta TaxID=230812 RepID=A0A8H7CK58_9AGAR|nr:Carboxylic ester hydrolase [Mycena sanguinolenta]
MATKMVITMMVYHPLLLAITILSLLHSFACAVNQSSKCLALKDDLNLENTTILDVAYIASPMNVSTAGSCQSSALVSAAPLCRVYLVINTTATSAVRAEAWLPDTWYGRFIGLGNGGLSGCTLFLVLLFYGIEYADLDYTTSLHFAAIASDNGHDGESGLPFLNQPEIINDFAFRAIHAEAVVGKQLVQAYYGHSASKSYFSGCSTGGRQATQAALRFPADFDGILAGAPATDFNHLGGWIGILGHYIGATNPDSVVNTSASFIPPELWNAVSAEILRQCDALDGVLDGIITEPDDCDFQIDSIRCEANATAGCASAAQADALQKIYTPLLDGSGRLIYPRYTPGAEADVDAAIVFGGTFSSLTADWERYAVLNVTEHDFCEFQRARCRVASRHQSWWGGNVRRRLVCIPLAGWQVYFVSRSKRSCVSHILPSLPVSLSSRFVFSFYPLISSTNSKRVYDLIAQTLDLAPAPATGPDGMDAFYRLFLVPGMGHCGGGLGPTLFGQGVFSGTNSVNDSAHNVLLALVEWVEDEVEPAVIVGSGDGEERAFCRYPIRSVWNGTVFVCEE